MSTSQPHEVIKLLSHELRWQMVRSLAISDHRVNELVTLVDQPLNLVSYHLRQLREGGLVIARRSEADGRDTYYSLDRNLLQTLYLAAGNAIHLSISESPIDRMNLPAKPRILFICTHNSARSQMAEGLMHHLGLDQVDVKSAGSEPASVHPDAIKTMKQLGIDIRQQQSKSLQEFANQHFDWIITVCDRAREVCPTFPGEGHYLHWGYRDPVTITDDQERRQAFTTTAQQLGSRIQQFLYELQTGALT